METKIKISIQFMCLIIVCFLLGCGVKGDPHEPLIGKTFYKNEEIIY